MGVLGDEQLTWLQNDLAARKADTPVVVFGHVPLFAVAPEWGWTTTDGTKAIAMLKRFNAATVLNGHIHQVSSTRTARSASRRRARPRSRRPHRARPARSPARSRSRRTRCSACSAIAPWRWPGRRRGTTGRWHRADRRRSAPDGARRAGVRPCVPRVRGAAARGRLRRPARPRRGRGRGARRARAGVEQRLVPARTRRAAAVPDRVRAARGARRAARLQAPARCARCARAPAIRSRSTRPRRSIRSKRAACSARSTRCRTRSAT